MCLACGLRPALPHSPLERAAHWSWDRREVWSCWMPGYESLFILPHWPTQCVSAATLTRWAYVTLAAPLFIPRRQSVRAGTPRRACQPAACFIITIIKRSSILMWHIFSVPKIWFLYPVPQNIQKISCMKVKLNYWDLENHLKKCHSICPCIWLLVSILVKKIADASFGDWRVTYVKSKAQVFWCETGCCNKIKC